MMNKNEFDKKLEDLTKQEKKILQLFLEGKSDSDIAQALICTEKTVRTHLSNICKKFKLTQETRNCSHREDLIWLFLEHKGEWVGLAARRRVKTTELEYPDGRVPLDSRFYISRDDSQGNIESRCYQEIKKPGALIRNRSPKLMGKTSFLSRILFLAENDLNVRTVEINFAQADQDSFNSIKGFFHWFSLSVGDALDLEDQRANFWRSSFGHKHNCTVYFERYLLPTINGPLVLGLDEVELIFKYEKVAQEFLSLLRLWHEKAKTSSIWNNFRVIMAYSTENYIEIKATQSPFNVGLLVELPDFSPQQITTLALRHELRWNNTHVDYLMDMIDGHPYLVRLALYYLATNQSISLEQLLEKAPTEEGIYRNHLWRLLTELRKDKTLEEAYKRVLLGEPNGVELDSMLIFFLDSLGLIKKKGNKVFPRCKLYYQYFSRIIC